MWHVTYLTSLIFIPLLLYIFFRFFVLPWYNNWGKACNMSFTVTLKKQYIQYLFDCKPWLIKCFSSFHATYNQGQHTTKGSLHFVSLAIERYHTQSFLGYILSTKFSSCILFSSVSCAHPLKKGLWWSEGSCIGVSIITRISN